MSEWITDRKPTKEDADAHGYVWVTEDDGQVSHMIWDCVTDEPWMTFKRPEPYVKAKRYEVVSHYLNLWCVIDRHCKEPGLNNIFPTREAAERIAAIYEEVTP